MTTMSLYRNLLALSIRQGGHYRPLHPIKLIPSDNHCMDLTENSPPHVLCSPTGRTRMIQRCTVSAIWMEAKQHPSDMQLWRFIHC